MTREPDDPATGYYDAKVQAFFDVWGGEHIHFGIFREPGESLSRACVRTMEEMHAMLSHAADGARTLDLGSGFGGAARFLASRGHDVTCVDSSAANNRVNRRLNDERGVRSIAIVDGAFESLALADGSFDVAWSQEAVCHSPDMEAVLREVSRVLRPGGELVLSNTCRGESIPAAVLRQLDERNSLSLMTIDFHDELARSLGFEVATRLDLSGHLSPHYRKMLEEVRARKPVFIARGGDAYFERVVGGLEYWLRTCDAGHLAWGIWKLVR